MATAIRFDQNGQLVQTPTLVGYQLPSPGLSEFGPGSPLQGTTFGAPRALPTSFDPYATTPAASGLLSGLSGSPTAGFTTAQPVVDMGGMQQTLTQDPLGTPLSGTGSATASAAPYIGQSGFDDPNQFFGPVGSSSGSGAGNVGTGSGVADLAPPTGTDANNPLLGTLDPGATNQPSGNLIDPIPSIGFPGVTGLLPDALTGGTTGTTGTSSDWWTTFTTLAANFFTRGIIVVLGVILLGAAAWAMASGEISAPKIVRKFA